MSKRVTPARHDAATRAAASAGASSGIWPAVLVLAGLSASAVALAAAPALMSPGYSWLANTTSESAAQGVRGAWLARLGFLLFGLSVIRLAALRGRDWGRWAAPLHTLFGVFMTAAAAFSTRSWVTGAGFDPTEDALHSIAASAMGFAFALGIAACAVHQHGQGLRWNVLDALAVAASVILPLGMSAWPEFDGVLQRAMFAVAYVWYAVEAARDLRGRNRVVSQSAARSSTL
jgi:hypothetical protein